MTAVLAWHPSVGAENLDHSFALRRIGLWGMQFAMRAHEAVMGRRTTILAGGLAISQHWSPQRLRETQFTKLRRLVDHAITHCPYYRDSHAQGRLPPGRMLRGFDDLLNIELLTREHLRRRARHMCWRGMPGKRLVDRSRGTTDEPIPYYWDRRRQAWDKAGRLRGYGWHGCRTGDAELHLWPADPPLTWPSRFKEWLRARRDDLFNELQVDSLHAFEEHLATTWQTWRHFDPELVTAYPSVLARLVQEGRRVRCRLGNPRLRQVFLTGEPTFPWQRALIETELGVPTVQTYGVQEAGALAFACERGNWHISAESSIIEIIRHGHPAAPGELGEVVVTGLESLAMPLLRYCTGDIVRAGPASCTCGRGLPVMPPVIARAADFLETDDGRWIEPQSVLETLGKVLEDGAFQVVQAADGSIEVGVLPSAGSPQPRQDAVADRVRRLVGSNARCIVRYVPGLRRSMFGKCRFVVSQRTARGLARPIEPMVKRHVQTTAIPGSQSGFGPRTFRPTSR